MDNNVTTTITPCNTIEHCSAKGFPSSSPSPPTEDLINNNPSTKNRDKTFGSSIISNANDHHNNELKNHPVSSTAMSNNNECLESGSVPDSDLTESLATATEALTEILVKKSGMDTNGNESLPLPKYHPNMSSSSTQTECPSSSSYHVCCCKEWNCWNLSSSSSANGKREQQRCDGDDSLPKATGMAVVVQCQSSNRCCHHRRKKTLESGVETIHQEKINHCKYNVVSTKYSKSWRELRKTTNSKRSSNMQICRIQSCNSRSPKPPV